MVSGKKIRYLVLINSIFYSDYGRFHGLFGGVTNEYVICLGVLSEPWGFVETKIDSFWFHPR